MATLFRNRLFVEIALVTLVVVSVIMKAGEMDGADSALMVTMFLLAGHYFLGAFFPSDDAAVFTTVAIKVIYISSAICVMGMMFAILKFSGPKELLMLGISSLGVAGVIVLVNGVKAWKNNYLFTLIRVVILCTASGIIFLHLLHQKSV